jgi:hypothetical protein
MLFKIHICIFRIGGIDRLQIIELSGTGVLIGGYDHKQAEASTLLFSPNPQLTTLRGL